MSHLRFTPAEYQAISHLCRPLDLRGYPLNALKRLLAGLLNETSPELATRISRLRSSELRLLRDHLLGQRRSPKRHDLTTGELRLLTEMYGPLLNQARFSRALKGTLVRDLGEASPGLAQKLHRMSHGQFETLCEQVKERLRRKA